MEEIKLDLPALELEFSELEKFLSSPDAYSSPDFSTKNRRHAELAELISVAKKRSRLETDLDAA